MPWGSLHGSPTPTPHSRQRPPFTSCLLFLPGPQNGSPCSPSAAPFPLRDPHAQGPSLPQHLSSQPRPWAALSPHRATPAPREPLPRTKADTSPEGPPEPPAHRLPVQPLLQGPPVWVGGALLEASRGPKGPGARAQVRSRSCWGCRGDSNPPHQLWDLRAASSPARAKQPVCAQDQPHPRRQVPTRSLGTTSCPGDTTRVLFKGPWLPPTTDANLVKSSPSTSRKSSVHGQATQNLHIHQSNLQLKFHSLEPPRPRNSREGHTQTPPPSRHSFTAVYTGRHPASSWAGGLSVHPAWAPCPKIRVRSRGPHSTAAPPGNGPTPEAAAPWGRSPCSAPN